MTKQRYTRAARTLVHHLHDRHLVDTRLFLSLVRIPSAAFV